jgi:hypothetical protein
MPDVGCSDLCTHQNVPVEHFGCFNSEWIRPEEFLDGLYVDLRWQGYTTKAQHAADESIWRRF